MERRLLLGCLALGLACDSPAPNAARIESAVSEHTPPGASTPPPTAPLDPAQTRRPFERSRLIDRRELGLLAIGAGGHPADYQVSIAQDLSSAIDVFAAPARVLFGDGERPIVAKLASPVRGGPASLEQKLGNLMAPRASRDSDFEAYSFSNLAAATRSQWLSELEFQTTQNSTSPLYVYVAGHGEVGVAAAWPQASVSVAEIVHVLGENQARRPVTLIVTTCFGGGFADLAFVDSDSSRGATSHDRCGLFATTADLPATGCDPNPDRRQQEGYGLRFLAALSRGEASPGSVGDTDIDGDGIVSLLEAHSSVRISSRSGDIPTTTSERYLRAVADHPSSGVHAPSAEIAAMLREESAVVRGIARRLSLGEISGSNWEELEGRLNSQLEVFEVAIQRVEESFEDARRIEDHYYRRAAGEILAKWPVLDDPWHPGYRQLIQKERGAVSSFFDRSQTYADYRQALLNAAGDEGVLWNLREAMAPWANLKRAMTTLGLATRLAEKGGDKWSRYQQFLECERRTP